MDLKQRAKQLQEHLPAVFLSLKHRNTPLSAKLLAAFTVCYALSPIDLIPDFIPVLGYLDDVILLPSLIILTVRLIPKDVYEECLSDSRDLWKEGKEKKWYYALPFILIWILIIIGIWKLIRGK